MISVTNKETHYATASQREVAKTAHEKGQDVSYTVNHTLSCYLVDMLGQTWAWVRDKRHADHHGHEEHGALWQWFVGEFIGDAAAIPVTLAVQRAFPGFMHGIEKTLEPVAGPVLKWSTKREAENWAVNHGKAPHGEEAKAYAKQMYRYEIEHLPQAIVWTALGVPLAVGMHKLVGMPGSPWKIGQYQLESKLLSSGLLIGARGVFPRKMHKWDSWTSEHIYAPLTRIFTGERGQDAAQSEGVVSSKDSQQSVAA